MASVSFVKPGNRAACWSLAHSSVETGHSSRRCWTRTSGLQRVVLALVPTELNARGGPWGARIPVSTFSGSRYSVSAKGPWSLSSVPTRASVVYNTSSPSRGQRRRVRVRRVERRSTGWKPAVSPPTPHPQDQDDMQSPTLGPMTTDSDSRLRCASQRTVVEPIPKP